MKDDVRSGWYISEAAAMKVLPRSFDSDPAIPERTKSGMHTDQGSVYPLDARRSLLYRFSGLSDDEIKEYRDMENAVGGKGFCFVPDVSKPDAFIRGTLHVPQRQVAETSSGVREHVWWLEITEEPQTVMTED